MTMIPSVPIVLLQRHFKIILEQNPGLRSKELSEKTGVTPVTIRRYMQKMQSVGLVVFKGSPKTGGYYLSDAISAKLVEYGKEKT